MKNIFLAAISIFLSINLWAQSPDKMSYQAVIRNADNCLVVNQQVGMRISILVDSPDGTVVYSEIHSPTTNPNGLVSIEVGAGDSQNDFSKIDWSQGAYFIKSETDIEGGSNYSIIGTSQLLSVPFALYAKEAENFSKSVAASITSVDTANWNKVTNKGLGTWSNLNKGVVYQAETDGFICTYSKESNQCSDHAIHIYQGSSETNIKEFYSKKSDMKLVLPIAKGTFFKITVTAGNYCSIKKPNASIQWMPMY